VTFLEESVRRIRPKDPIVLNRFPAVLAVVAVLAVACGKPPPGPGQVKDAVCDYTLKDACAVGLFCYSEERDQGGLPKMQIWGFPGAKKSVAIGRCATLVAEGGACSYARSCAAPAQCVSDGSSAMGEGKCIAPNAMRPVQDVRSIDSAPVALLGQPFKPADFPPTCQVNKRCAAVPSIVACEAIGRVPSEEFDAVWKAVASNVGKRVTVRGYLSALGGCTEKSCPRQCCNSCEGEVVLTGSADRAGTGQFHFLRDSGERKLVAGPFFCQGDDSAVCCGSIADRRMVVVTATLTSENNRYVLNSPEFCQP